MGRIFQEDGRRSSGIRRAPISPAFSLLGTVCAVAPGVCRFKRKDLPFSYSRIKSRFKREPAPPCLMICEKGTPNKGSLFNPGMLPLCYRRLSAAFAPYSGGPLLPRRVILRLQRPAGSSVQFRDMLSYGQYSRPPKPVYGIRRLSADRCLAVIAGLKPALAWDKRASLKALSVNRRKNGLV